MPMPLAASCDKLTKTKTCTGLQVESGLCSASYAANTVHGHFEVKKSSTLRFVIQTFLRSNSTSFPLGELVKLAEP